MPTAPGPDSRRARRSPLPAQVPADQLDSGPAELLAAAAPPDGARLRERIGRAVRAAHAASVPF